MFTETQFTAALRGVSHCAAPVRFLGLDRERGSANFNWTFDIEGPGPSIKAWPTLDERAIVEQISLAAASGA